MGVNRICLYMTYLQYLIKVGRKKIEKRRYIQKSTYKALAYIQEQMIPPARLFIKSKETLMKLMKEHVRNTTFLKHI